MVQVRPILFVLGLLLSVLAAFMLLPAGLGLIDAQDDWPVFLGSSVFTFFVGGLLLLMNYDETPVALGLKEGFTLTTAGWIIVPAFAAIPFAGLGYSYTDAIFEATSGVTTTGSTVLVGLDKLPRGLLLWRALLNWMGGLGVIAMAMLILPFLRIGGMQLFRFDRSKQEQKVMPRALELVAAITMIYLGLSFACATAFTLLGMSTFDAICHAMSTISTGGFSTHDESFGFFKSNLSTGIQLAAMFFMIAGALPFVAYIRVARGEVLAPLRDAQVRGLLVFLFVTTALMTLWLASVRDLPWGEALRLTAFHVTSIVTTAGFSTTDYQPWGEFSIGVFFILTFIGGCAGSTAGGIKIYRLQIAAVITQTHLMHLISPSRIVPLNYNRRRLPADVPFSVIAFLVIYMGAVGVIAVLLSAMGLDMTTAISSAASAISNVGPGLGKIVGPGGSYEPLPAIAKWLLAFTMILGRLELFAVLVLLRPEFWRR